MSINKDEYKINDLRTTIISIPMIHVGQMAILIDKVYSGWIPLPPRSIVKNTEVEPITEEKTTVKKSNAEAYDKLADNTGLYEIDVTAIETNPYKIKAENKQATIESYSESSTAILKAIIESLTKEKEENKDSEK